MKIVVTEDHLDRGWPNNVDRCPIALALKDAGHPGVVEADTVFFRDHPNKEVLLPEVARHFIERFDDHEDVEPFEFDLDVPGTTPV